MASLFRSVLDLFQATKAAEPEPPCPLLALTDDLLQEIFLRLGSRADLVRASAACVAFRRLIAGTSFLRRYRALHPPVFLGFISSAGFHSADARHPSAAAAGFSFDDYLPRGSWSHWHWDLCDVRNGLVLLKCSYEGLVFPDLTVCDPLSRRYLLLPPIPNELLSSVQIQEQDIRRFEASLVPCSGEEEDDKSFRVIGRMDCLTNFVVVVFSSISGCWSVGASISWDALSLNIPRVLMLGRPQCAYGSFYWKIKTNKLLKLDMNTMEFSTDDLPHDHDERDLVIVEAGEGELAMFSRIYQSDSVDFYTFLQNGSERTNEWHVKDTIPLPNHYRYYIIGSAEEYIFLAGVPKFQDSVHTAYFSLEIKTFNIERVSIMWSPFCYVYPYFGFLPSFTKDSRI